MMKERLSLGLKDTAQASAQAAAYSRRVGRLRWMLPLVAVGGLALLFFWPRTEGSPVAGLLENVPNLMVQDLRLTGRDSQDQAYELVAAKVFQAGSLENVVDLDAPRGEITLKDGRWLVATAVRGRYDQKKEKLWLGGGVEIFYDEEGKMMAQDLFVDIKKNAAWSQNNVVFEGSFGRIKSAGFRALDAGKIVVFEGPAVAQLNLSFKAASDKLSVNDFKAP